MKKITALFTVALMLVASAAFADVVPGAFQTGKTKTFTGFTVNGTSGSNSTKSFQMMTFNSSVGGYVFGNNSGFDNSSAGNVINASSDFSVFNGSEQVNVFLLNNTSQDVFSWTWGGEYNFLANSAIGATTSFYEAVGGTFLPGLSTVTITNSTAAGAQAGANVQFLYDNGTTLGDTFGTDTWSYYAFGVDNGTAGPMTIIADVKMTAQSGSDNAQVKFYQNDGGTKTDSTSAWIAYNAATNAAGTNLSLTTSNTGPTLFDFATINADRNIITGWVNGTSSAYYAVMIRNAGTISTEDMTNRSFRLLYAGVYTTPSAAYRNATAGLIEVDLDANLIIDGSASVRNQTTTQDLDGCYVEVASTTQFGLTQSNMTIYDRDGSTIYGTFVGKQSADKDIAAGIFQPANGTNGYALAILIPNGVSTGDVVAAAPAYQNNATLNLNSTTQNATSYSAKQMREIWSALPSDFIPLTGTVGFEASYAEAQKGDVYYTFQFNAMGLGEKISNLRLYKVFPTADATVRSFSYASAATPAVEGSWWVSTNNGDGYLSEGSTLSSGNTYRINYVIKDNGNYDANGATKFFTDPVVIGTVPNSATSSSSSSSGCVFNPAAGFGLEWLLLMLAPMVAIVRSRFKK